MGYTSLLGKPYGLLYTAYSPIQLTVDLNKSMADLKKFK